MPLFGWLLWAIRWAEPFDYEDDEPDPD